MGEEKKHVVNYSNNLKSYHRNPSPEIEAEQEKTRKMRLCLKCDPPKKFLSNGPWNRVCEKCNHINERVFKKEHASKNSNRDIKPILEDY